MRSFPEIEEYFRMRLNERSREDALRTLEFSYDLIDFSSNDFLGLAKNSVDDFNALLPLKHGSGGSRLLTGNSKLTEQLESEIAAFHGSESALIFTSGYAANLGLISCIAGRNDTILYDEYVHASLRDGIRLSLAKSWSFTHNSTDSLREKIKRASGKIFIVVESLYSMGGEPSPLTSLVDIAREYNAGLIVDEAHATGIAGENGEGLVSELNLGDSILARVITFGKALGCHGAAVACSETLKEYLVNFSRPFIYTTALPDAVIQTIRLHYQKMKNVKDSRAHLYSLIKDFRQTADELGIPVLPSEYPIQSILIPGNTRVKKCSGFLRENGVEARAILSPTVPRDEERIRICIHSFNTRGEIIYLLHHVKKFLNE